MQLCFTPVVLNIICKGPPPHLGYDISGISAVIMTKLLVFKLFFFLNELKQSIDVLNFEIPKIARTAFTCY